MLAVAGVSYGEHWDQIVHSPAENTGSFFLLYLTLSVFAVLPFVWNALGSLESQEVTRYSFQSEKEIKLFTQAG